MSGSSCATTGSRTASSNPTTISSTIAVTLGTSSSISPGASCPSDCANGRTGSDQWELVLYIRRDSTDKTVDAPPGSGATKEGERGGFAGGRRRLTSGQNSRFGRADHHW